VADLFAGKKGASQAVDGYKLKPVAGSLNSQIARLLQ
jgi:hypothetical protein